MRKIFNEKKVFRLCVMISLLGLNSSCQRSEFQTQSSSGYIQFGKSIERAYKRLAEKGIRKKAGFYNDCSVDFRSESGMEISESVCDDGENALKVTIQITDTGVRPPSQRQDQIDVVLEGPGKKSLLRGKTEQFPNGTSIQIDRTGQLAVLTRRQLISP